MAHVLLKHRSLRRDFTVTAFARPKDNSFATFESSVSALWGMGATSRDIGDVWEVFCEAFLLTDPEVHASDVWPMSAVPSTILQDLDIPAEDKGCDGVYRRIDDGALIAYQCKFRSNRSNLTWDELGTFVGLSERADGRLILTNADEVSEIALGRPNVSAIRGGHFRGISDDHMAEIFALVAGQPVIHVRHTSRPHQEAALTDILAGLGDSNRVTALMACGTGKTLIALWAAQRLEATTVLVLLPSLALIRQTLAEWASHNGWGNRFRFLAVCCDETVVDDELQVLQSDIPYCTTTSPARIRKFMECPGDRLVRVVFSTYHSVRQLAAGLGDMVFDFGVFDEAHKTAGRAGALYTTALLDDTVRISKRLFLTATQRVYSGSATRELSTLYSMDDETVYGKVVHNLTFGRAAELGIICRYKVIVSVVSSGQIAALIGTSETVVDGKVLEAYDVAGQIAVARAVEQYGLTRVFTFHHTLKAARAFVASGASGVGHHLPPGFATVHLSGDMRVSEREAVLGRFRASPRGLASNVRCLTEGVDLPAVDLVAFLSRKRSKVDIVQAVGRASRKTTSGSKQFGYVLIPLLVNLAEGEAVEDAVGRASFDPVWDVLSSLMSQDEALVECISDLRREHARSGRLSGGGLGRFVEFVGTNLPMADLSRAISIRMVNHLAVGFDAAYSYLRAYVAREGSACVPHTHIEDNFQLGRWVCVQRVTRATLLPERAARLESLQGWAWDAYAIKFENGLRCLRSFLAREGHIRVHKTHLEAGLKLGDWIHQRRKYRQDLLPERVAALEAIPGWTWDFTGDLFDKGIANLSAYVAREGNARVPVLHKEDGFGLGQWVQDRRKSKDKIPAARILRLEAIDGWTWSVFTNQFDQGIAWAKVFAEREGHVRVPTPHSESGFPLGRWVSSQRATTLNSDPERRARLEQLPGWVWNILSDRFETAIAHLSTYAAREGHARVNAKHCENGFPLGAWVSAQRRARASISPERAAQLEAITQWSWAPLGVRFDEGIKSLQVFVEREQHAHVPSLHHEGDFALGNWVKTQRASRHNYSKQRIARLNAIKGWSWGRSAAA